MPSYSEEFREQAVRKMMPPNAQSLAQVSRVGVDSVVGEGAMLVHGTSVGSDTSIKETHDLYVF